MDTSTKTTGSFLHIVARHHIPLHLSQAKPRESQEGRSLNDLCHSMSSWRSGVTKSCRLVVFGSAAFMVMLALDYPMQTLGYCDLFSSLDSKLRVDRGNHFSLGHKGRKVRHRKVCVSTSDISSQHRPATSACAHVTGSNEDPRELLRVSWQRRTIVHRRTSTQKLLLARSRLHWSQRSDRIRPRSCVVRGKVIDPVSVSTVLLTSSEQDPLERHNHKLLAEHCDTRNIHEPLALLAASSVLAAFIMAVLPLNVCGVCKTLGICVVFRQFVCTSTMGLVSRALAQNCRPLCDDWHPLRNLRECTGCLAANVMTIQLKLSCRE